MLHRRVSVRTAKAVEYLDGFPLTSKLRGLKHVTGSELDECAELTKLAASQLSTKYVEYTTNNVDRSGFKKSAKGSNLLIDSVMNISMIKMLIDFSNFQAPGHSCRIKDIVYLSETLIKSDDASLRTESTFKQELVKIFQTLEGLEKYFLSNTQLYTEAIVKEFSSLLNSFLKVDVVNDISATTNLTAVAILFMQDFLIRVESFFDPLPIAKSSVANYSKVDLPQIIEDSDDMEGVCKKLIIKEFAEKQLTLLSDEKIKISDVCTYKSTGFEINPGFYAKIVAKILDVVSNAIIPQAKLLSQFDNLYSRNLEFAKAAYSLAGYTDIDLTEYKIFLPNLIKQKGVTEVKEKDQLEYFLSTRSEKDKEFNAMVNKVVDKYFTSITTVDLPSVRIYNSWIENRSLIYRIDLLDYAETSSVILKYINRKNSVLISSMNHFSTEVGNLSTENLIDLNVRSGFEKPGKKSTCSTDGTVINGSLSELRTLLCSLSEHIVLDVDEAKHTVIITKDSSLFTIKPPCSGPDVVSFGTSIANRRQNSGPFFTIEKIEPETCSGVDLLMSYRYTDVQNLTSKGLETLYNNRIELLRTNTKKVASLVYGKSQGFETITPCLKFFFSGSDTTIMNSLAKKEEIVVLPSGTKKVDLLNNVLPTRAVLDKMYNKTYVLPAYLLKQNVYSQLGAIKKFESIMESDGLPIVSIEKLAKKDNEEVFKLTIHLDIGKRASTGLRKVVKNGNQLSISLQYDNPVLPSDFSIENVSLVKNGSVVSPIDCFADKRILAERGDVANHILRLINSWTSTCCVLAQREYDFCSKELSSKQVELGFKLVEKAVNHLLDQFSEECSILSFGGKSSSSLKDLKALMESDDFTSGNTAFFIKLYKLLNAVDFGSDKYEKICPKRLIQPGDLSLLNSLVDGSGLVIQSPTIVDDVNIRHILDSYLDEQASDMINQFLIEDINKLTFVVNNK